ncbi:ribokinase [Chloroflexota bacterium]
MLPKIAVVGSLNMDLIVRTPHIPNPGETIIGRGFHTAPGGKGANQAVAAARLGAQVSMVGRVGKDDFATTLLENLTMANVNTQFVIQDPEAPTGVALIEVDDSGENSIVVASGANMRVTSLDVDAAQEAISAADLLLLQLEIPLKTVLQAVLLAKRKNVTVVLNPAPAMKLTSETLSLVDILIPNESETALLTGLPVGSRSEIRAAASSLLTSGVNTVILTLGENGALLTQEGKSEIIPSIKINPVDTTAAGDAFVGGFAVALAERKSVTEAIRWGNAAGALATTRLGAQPSLPMRQDVEMMLEGQVA